MYNNFIFDFYFNPKCSTIFAGETGLPFLVAAHVILARTTSFSSGIL
jgi:hypothetical protein